MGVHGETPPPPPLIKSFQDCRKQAFKPVAVAFVTAGLGCCYAYIHSFIHYLEV
eukprot:m.41747 g.41747  ORF g.41747 m.41747 type:complete len:54 (+) comp46247_c0_seq1:204-365(+)